MQSTERIHGLARSSLPAICSGSRSCGGPKAGAWPHSVCWLSELVGCDSESSGCCQPARLLCFCRLRTVWIWGRWPTGIECMSGGPRMARFYEDVPIQWKEGETSYGRGLGNHVAWRCKCDHLMLAPHEELYFVPACPTCGRKFRVLKGKKPRYVKRVIERVERPYRRT